MKIHETNQRTVLIQSEWQVKGTQYLQRLTALALVSQRPGLESHMTLRKVILTHFFLL